MKPLLPPGVHLSAPPGVYRSRLLDWFHDHQRALPWRRNRSLYGTWISEVMLQQTTVATAEPYWEKFLTAFPDVAALAAASEEDVLSHWSGLGYYRRARQLHAAARMVVADLGGKLPGDREGWLTLPGIGPYASGAIASIGLGERVPAIDGNSRRVLSRWYVADPEVAEKLKPAHLEMMGGELVDEGRPGDWNEALMELGALVCRAAEPRCQVCPMGELCRAGEAGTARKIPPPKTRAPVTGVRLGLLVLRWGDSVLLLPPGSDSVAFPADEGASPRRDLSGLHKGLWGLPSTPWMPDPAGKGTDWPGRIWSSFLLTETRRSNARPGGTPKLLGRFRHAITRYRLEVLVYGLRLTGIAPHAGESHILPSESLSLEGVGDSRELKVDAPPNARYAICPPTDLPVSNLVRKSLIVAWESSI